MGNGIDRSDRLRYYLDLVAGPFAGPALQDHWGDQGYDHGVAL